MADSDWMFWDEMWNQSSDKKTQKSTACCGDWDELGICNCKKDKNEEE
jgi:hypothetical protein